ncbi:DUF1534 domain-containing protein [Pseudomonas syringae pv. pisi str. PP1]|nr:DUF1534 domain-containing protein [Pseudomonas syringae pv. pisi str. PP1]
MTVTVLSAHHASIPFRALNIGRGASRTACPRGVGTIVIWRILVSHAPVGMPVVTLCVTRSRSPSAGCDAAQPGRGIRHPDDLLPGAGHRQTAFRATCHWRIRSCRRRVSEAPAPTVRPRQ